MTATFNRRPPGATVLSLALGWLAIAGFGNAVAWRAAGASFNQPMPGRLAAVVDSLQSPVFTLLALSYGVTALLTAVGLWRMRAWMLRAYLAWALSVMVLLAWMLTIVPSQLVLSGTLGLVAFVALIGALLLAIYSYIARIARSLPRVAL